MRTEPGQVSHKTRTAVKRAHTPMLIVEHDGTIKFRTKLFRSEARAGAWARCLDNSRYFTDAEVVRYERAKGAAWIVTFLPKNSERRDAMRDRLQAERTVRCTNECSQYKWANVSYDRTLRLCTTLSGNTYRVSATDCTCDDYQCRCKSTGMWCKHILAFNMTQVGAETVDADPFANEVEEDQDADPFADEPSPFAVAVAA